jgi:hypothetical protein
MIMPAAMHKIQTGKNDPTMLTEGACSQPATGSKSRSHINLAFNFVNENNHVSLRLRLDGLRVQQIAGAERKIRNLVQHLRTSSHVCRARLGQCALRGYHI